MLRAIVRRAKLCLDFACTFYFYHLLFTWHYGGFPAGLLWWLMMGASLCGMAMFGEYLCMRKEMEPILLTGGTVNSSNGNGRESTDALNAAIPMSALPTATATGTATSSASSAAPSRKAPLLANNTTTAASTPVSRPASSYNSAANLTNGIGVSGGTGTASSSSAVQLSRKISGKADDQITQSLSISSRQNSVSELSAPRKKDTTM